jgi:hypothetical protein
MRNRIKFIQASVKMVALENDAWKVQLDESARIGREEWAMVSGRFSWFIEQFKPLQL